MENTHSYTGSTGAKEEEINSTKYSTTTIAHYLEFKSDSYANHVLISSPEDLLPVRVSVCVWRVSV